MAAKTKKIEKSVPVIAEPEKPAKTAKEKVPTLSRTARAAAIAALSPEGWQIVSKTPVMYDFTCVCNGHGRKGFILEPVGIKPRAAKGGDDDSYTGADWLDFDAKTAGIVKVGASCLYHFGIAL
jgi:hypothetical protein